MKENEGAIDRVVRAIAGIALLAVAYYAVAGYLAWIVAVVGGILVITGAIGWCPAYAIFGIKTCATGEPAARQH